MKNIKIVLVEPSHPGNIGSTARAMKTMGLSKLVLVKPKHFPHADAQALASSATDILESAQVVNTFSEAVADCVLVLGTSSRGRTFSAPCVVPKVAAEELLAKAKNGRVALVFGRENYGLYNEELELCHKQVIIPTNPEYASLNLAMAVQILCYEIFQIHEQPILEMNSEPLAAHESVEGLFTHLERVLLKTGYLDPKNPRLLRPRLKRFLLKSELTAQEVQIFRGILTSFEKLLP